MIAVESKAAFTAPEVAEMLGVNLSKVCEWIRAGELRAINVAKSVKGNRPRYRILRAALDDFARARSVVPPTPQPTHRRRQPEGIPDYLAD